jgi:site-specific recombinase XerD
MAERAAAGAGLELKAHPHMLRHACGYALANKGHDTPTIQGCLGRRSITSTAAYTALAPNRFKDFCGIELCGPSSLPLVFDVAPPSAKNVPREIF